MFLQLRFSVQRGHAYDRAPVALTVTVMQLHPHYFMSLSQLMEQPAKPIHSSENILFYNKTEKVKI